MALTDHKYLACTMADGTVEYLPVSKDMACSGRPTVAQAQAQVSLLLPASFVPTGYFLSGDGCLISTNPGGGDPDPGTPGDPGSSGGTDSNPLASTDISGENNVIYEQAP